MGLRISDQYSSLSPISHRLATIHLWQTTTTDDDGRQPCQSASKTMVTARSS